MMAAFSSAEQSVADLPMQRWRVMGRNHFGAHEIGYFFGRTPMEAVAECRRRKSHLCGGLKLHAEGRL